jgi:hypothetical protein
MGNFIAETALAEFDHAIALARTPDEAFGALRALAEATVGVKLFTVMTIDMVEGVACRAYTSEPEVYPATGTKPIHQDDWFDIVHRDRRPFVANTIEEIAKFFPDHELINSLGCQSVVNLPVTLRGELVATVNMLHETGYYTPRRVDIAVRHLSMPAKLAYLLAA